MKGMICILFIAFFVYLNERRHRFTIEDNQILRVTRQISVKSQ